MIFDEVKPITRLEAEAGFASGITGRICDSLIRVTYHDPDWRWVQNVCLRLVNHSNGEISGLAVSCLGHLARMHRVLDVEKVLPTLRKLREDPKISGRVDDALDDIKTYLGGDVELD